MSIRRFVGLCVVALVARPIAFTGQTAAPDLTGHWSGKFMVVIKEGAAPAEEAAYAVFAQKGTEITGTVGPGADRQFAIHNGKVETTTAGTRLTFDEGPGRPPKHFELKLVDGRLKGTMYDGGDPNLVTIELQRSK